MEKATRLGAFAKSRDIDSMPQRRITYISGARRGRRGEGGHSPRWRRRTWSATWAAPGTACCGRARRWSSKVPLPSGKIGKRAASAAATAYSPWFFGAGFSASGTACPPLLGARAITTLFTRKNSATTGGKTLAYLFSRGQLAAGYSPDSLARVRSTRSTTPSVGKRRVAHSSSHRRISGYAATALYNGGRTRNRLAKSRVSLPAAAA